MTECTCTWTRDQFGDAVDHYCDVCRARDEDVELESPNFTPDALRELAERGYRRVNVPRPEPTPPEDFPALEPAHEALEPNNDAPEDDAALEGGE